jgi:hypothetical protein
MIEKMEDPNTRHQWLVFLGGNLHRKLWFLPLNMGPMKKWTIYDLGVHAWKAPDPEKKSANDSMTCQCVPILGSLHTGCIWMS